MVYIFLADGFEECEALIPIDILRRANIDIKTVGVGSKTIIGSHNIPIVCDITIEEADILEQPSAVILPGGMPGTLNLENNSKVIEFVKKAMAKNNIVAAICAAPSILGHLGFLNGKKAVCYPSFEKELIGAFVLDNPVVTDGNIITAKGVGAAFDFGYEILNHLTQKFDETENLKQVMIYK